MIPISLLKDTHTAEVCAAGMEFHVGSAPARSSVFGHGGLTASESVSEPPLVSP